MTTTQQQEPQPAPDATAFVGIDVSKDKLDVFVMHSPTKGKWHKFPNTDDGHSKLLSWARSQSPSGVRHFCMESTGTYGLALALYLHEAHERISVVNPTVIKYSGPDGAANKTDKVDARKIADFTRKEQPKLWQPPAPEMRKFISLVRYIDVLTVQQAEAKGRLAEPGLDDEVRSSQELLLATYAEQIEGFRKKIKSLLDKHPGLRHNVELLDTIPGVAEATAYRLLAEMSSIGDCPTAQSAAAYAGLSPKEFTSGSSVKHKTRISKAGNKHLRHALYFPAMAALRSNDRFKAFSDRLAAKGKCKMSIICAAMRKIVMIAYGVLKSQQPFAKEFLNITNSSLAKA